MASANEQAATSAVVPTETEAYQTLLARAHRKTGATSPEMIVRHVLSITRDADWPVKREALEAVLRRVASGKSDGLQIVSRPGGGRLLGFYATRRKGSPARPYRTLLRGVERVDGSCDCADFLRNSLGLCKHLLVVLEDVTSRPRAIERARREPPPSAAPLRWDPVRPLTGAGDWLAQVRWVDDTADRGLERWLRPAKGGGFTLRVPEVPARRLQLVEKLRGALRGGHSEPALHAMLQEDRRRSMRSIQGASGTDRLRAALRTLKQRLYPYQREAVERFLSIGRLLLADDMGLGKTAQAIAACHALWRSGRVHDTGCPLHGDGAASSGRRPRPADHDTLMRLKCPGEAHRWEFKAPFRRRAFGWKSERTALSLETASPRPFARLVRQANAPGAVLIRLTSGHAALIMSVSRPHPVQPCSTPERTAR